MRNWEQWPYVPLLLWSKIYACICLSQHASCLHDCTLFKDMKTVLKILSRVQFLKNQWNIPSFRYSVMSRHTAKTDACLILCNLTKSCSIGNLQFRHQHGMGLDFHLVRRWVNLYITFALWILRLCMFFLRMF